ncbi:restriction endonuclease subunit S, partial [Bifidobacterium adolescentis]
DSLITLHQRKYDKLCVLKKSMLDKMFPKGGSLYPEIRFAGFTDPWEQRKLGELSNEFKSGEFICADNVSVSGSYPVYGGNGLRGYTTTFNHEGLYTLIGRQGALCGNVNIADGKSYFTEHAVAVKANHLNDTTFLYYLFGTLDLGQYSGQSAQPGLAVSNLVEVEAMVPDKAEQKKISRVFKTVDSLITLHQRKYDKLCVLKKSMLDKMFPKGGSLYPEIRFAGFTDPWEQRKLGELSNEFKSGEFICADNVSVSGSYPVYGGNGLRGYTTTFNHEGLYTLIGRQGALCGNVNIADGKSYFTEHAVAVKANHLNDTTFLYYLFGTLDLGQYSGQSAQPGLAVSNLVEVEAMVPDKAEQKKISRVFKTVDSLITLHQRKLELLRNIKKSMLDKMFV